MKLFATKNYHKEAVKFKNGIIFALLKVILVFSVDKKPEKKKFNSDVGFFSFPDSAHENTGLIL